MHDEIKDQWVAALRSGDYVQGVARLHTVNDEFCVLGVLCDLAYKAGVVERRLNGPGTSYGYGRERLTTYVPNAVIRWAGTVTDGDYDSFSAQLVLDRLNDDGQKTLYELGDWIEQNL